MTASLLSFWLGHHRDVFLFLSYQASWMSCYFGLTFSSCLGLSLSWEGKDKEWRGGWDRVTRDLVVWCEIDRKKEGWCTIWRGRREAGYWEIRILIAVEDFERGADLVPCHWETGLLNFLLSGAHGEDLTMVCVWLRVLTSNAKDKGIEKVQSLSTIRRMSVWVDKEITSWSKMIGNSITAAVLLFTLLEGAMTCSQWRELSMFWTRKLEWILAVIWIPC